MTYLIDTSQVIKALEVLKNMPQIKPSNIDCFNDDIQCLISTFESSCIIDAEIINLFILLGKKLCDDKLVNYSQSSNYFEVAFEFLETHYKFVSSRVEDDCR